MNVSYNAIVRQVGHLPRVVQYQDARSAKHKK